MKRTLVTDKPSTETFAVVDNVPLSEKIHKPTAYFINDPDIDSDRDQHQNADDGDEYRTLQLTG